MCNIDCQIGSHYFQRSSRNKIDRIDKYDCLIKIKCDDREWGADEKEGKAWCGIANINDFVFIHINYCLRVISSIGKLITDWYSKLFHWPLFSTRNCAYWNHINRYFGEVVLVSIDWPENEERFIIRQLATLSAFTFSVFGSITWIADIPI